MFYLDFGGFQLFGASPEVHVKVKEGRAVMRPIAGTRRRGATEAEDRRLEAELLADEKERAEHLMLVDLARNDLGRICVPGSVRVTESMVVERYSHVMHIVSQVEGALPDGVSGIEAIRATFPAGTVSGAPKIRAMEVIDGLEREIRGFYAGIVGYVESGGTLDTCIAIRSALRIGDRLVVQAGAGIVYDSVPEREYEETQAKLGALGKALGVEV
jgi:anthranilate synthase component 1